VTRPGADDVDGRRRRVVRRPGGRTGRRPGGTDTAAGSTAGDSSAGSSAVAEPPAGTTADTARGTAEDGSGASGTTARKTGAGRGGAPWWLLGVVGALALAGLVTSALLLLSRPSDDSLRDSALQAAQQYTTTLTSFDARTLEEDIERVKGVSAEEFVAEYEQTMAGLREQIASDQTVSVGSVLAVGMERLDGDEATVLVAVNQQITSAGAEPRTEANRVRMTLVRGDGSWLVRSVARL
jgi:Mce-associated membrane protein